MDLSNKSHLSGIVVALLIIAALGVVFFMNKKQTDDTAEKTDASETQANVTPAQTAETAPSTSRTGALIKTNMGDIEVEFFGADAPKTVESFTRLSQSGFYDNTKFHRVIKNFMIQGGDPFSKNDAEMGRWGTGGPGYQFDDEINSHKIVRGVLAMANSGPGTNGSQFFIVTAQATPWLDGAHTVFGRVVKGMETVDKIEATKVGPNDVPVSPVIVLGITLK